MHTLGGALTLGLVAAVVVPTAAPALALPGQEPDSKEVEVLLLRAERVIVRPGKVLEGAQVLVRDGRIAAVGSDLKAPKGARVIEGRVVCAGFIDAWSALGVSGDALSDTTTSAATRAADGFDPYNLDHLRREALRSGVTSARVQAGASSRVGGLGALVRLLPGATAAESLILPDSNLWATIGLGRGEISFEMQPDGTILASGGRALDVFERIDTLDRLISAITAGRNYRIAQNEHRHDLEEWQKKIVEKEAELEKEFKKAKKDREKAEKEATEKGKKFEEKKYKEDKKPAPPRYDEDNEVLARAAAGEAPLFVHANRAAEIRGLLLGTAEMNRLRLVLAGAAESLGSAKQLAERRVPVLVAPLMLGRFRPDEQEGLDPALPARLAKEGVTVLLGSGGTDPAATRDLPLLAQIAIGHGLERETAFEALTLGAARALDAAGRLGSVEVGKDADLLVLDGEPLEARTRVRYVIVGGRLAVTPQE